MQNLTFLRENGNVPKTLSGEDHISGLLFYMATLPDGFSASERIKAISTIDTAEALGITSDAEDWNIRMLHYQLSEVFRVNPGVSLYVGIYAKPTGANTFAEVKAMQNYTGGRLRQIGVWCGDVKLSADDLTALQGVATTLEAQDTPLSILYAPKIERVSALPNNLAGANKKNVSVLIGQAGSSTGMALYTDAANKTLKTTVSGLGVLVGLVSLASVHESVAWVEKYPTGVDVPAFGDGTLLNTLDKAVIESLDASRYLFFLTYPGLSGSYMNDSHTMDSATSDYAMIENVRTMDKAVRGIRTYLLPKLGGSLYIDKSTGKMQTYTVEHLKTTAQKAIEDMEKAGELSGYSVEIDPDQNVLATSTVEIVVKQVGVGVLRKLKIKIGYAESV